MLKLSAFRSPDFRLYLVGNAFALHAMWVHRIAVAWLAWALSGSAAYVGWIAFLGFAPTLVTGPLFGVLVDRLPVRQAAMQSQGALFALYIATAALYSAGLLGTLALPAIALGIGIVSSAHHPVRMSLGPLLVPKGDIASLVTATALNFNLARTAGPALGGIIIARHGIDAALWGVVLLSLPYQIAIPFLHPRDRKSDGQSSGRTLIDGLARGLGFAAKTPFIRDILLTTTLYALIARGMMEVLPLVADGIFARGAAGLGALTSAVGMGALAASAAMTVVPPPKGGVLPLRGQIAALTCSALGIALATSTNWPLSLAAAAALGAGGSIVGVSMQSALQPALPDDYRGRVMSLWVMAGIGGSALGALAIGLLTEAVGLAAAGLGLGLCICSVLCVLPRLTRLWDAAQTRRPST